MTMTLTSLQIAIHEAGHAVAHLVLDDLAPSPGPFISSVSIVPGDGFLGIVIADSRLSKSVPATLADPHFNDAIKQNNRLHALYDIIEALAGPTAELYCEHPLIPLLLMERMIPRILVDHADEDSDCANIRRAIEWLEEDNPQLLLRQLWNIAYAVIATEWIGLMKVARVLNDRQTMDGEEFEAEWRKVRQSERARSRREDRLGDLCVGWRSILALARMKKTEPQRLALMS